MTAAGESGGGRSWLLGLFFGLAFPLLERVLRTRLSEPAAYAAAVLLVMLSAYPVFLRGRPPRREWVRGHPFLLWVAASAAYAALFYAFVKYVL